MQVRMKEVKSSKLFDIHTGKKAPVGATKSKRYINLSAYVRRHVQGNKIARTTYVNAITGKPDPGITEETHQRGKHITLYVWQVRQKYTEFSQILKEDGDLPPVPSSKINMRKKAATADEQKADLLPADSFSVPPIKKAEKLSILLDIHTGKKAPEGASASEQYISFPTYVRRHVESTKLTKTTYVVAKTGEPAPGITKETHQRGQHTTLYLWRVSKKYAEFSKILEEGGDLPPAPLKKRTKQQNAQAVLERSAHMLLTLSTFIPPTAEAASASAHPHSLCRTLLGQTAVTSGAVTHPRMTSAVSAEQDTLELNPIQKRKPNCQAFFKPKENDRVGLASKKAKTMFSDGSAGHSLPLTDASDSISEGSFIPSPSVKIPTL